MKQVFNNLKSKEILYSRAVAALKEYIELKYPDADASVRAQVFADAVHKILDRHMQEFNPIQQRQIKRDVLLRAAEKDNFEIVAYDIMKTCVALKMDEEDFLEDLTSWLNHQQEVPVYRHQLMEIIEAVKAALAEEQHHKLLEQVDSAIGYNPNQFEPDVFTPELYVQGVVNEAYEEEMRLETTEVEEIDYDDLLPIEEYHRDSGTDIELEANEKVDSDTKFYELIGDDGQTAYLTVEDQDDGSRGEKSVITVETDVAPYIFNTPELWDEKVPAKNILHRIKHIVTDSDMVRIFMAAAGLLMVTMAVLWLIWYVIIQGDDMDGQAVMPEIMTAAMEQSAEELTAYPDVIEEVYVDELTESSMRLSYESVKPVLRILSGPPL